MIEPAALVVVISPTMVLHLSQPNERGRATRTLCGTEVRRSNTASGYAGWFNRGSPRGQHIDCMKCTRIRERAERRAARGLAT